MPTRLKQVTRQGALVCALTLGTFAASQTCVYLTRHMDKHEILATDSQNVLDLMVFRLDRADMRNKDFMLSNDRRWLEERAKEIALAREKLMELSVLIKDRPEQLVEIQHLLNHRIAYFDRMLEEKATNISPGTPTLALINLNTQQLRNISQEIIYSERHILEFEKDIEIGASYASIILLILTLLAAARFSWTMHYLFLKDQGTYTRLNHQQDLLVKELNHRVKNSLAMVSGMLSMQARQATKEIQSALNDASNRVRVIASLHEGLYNGVEMDGRVLLEKVIASLEAQNDIKIASDIKKIPKLSIDVGLPISVIANELITNAIKYGQGEITVILDMDISKSKKKWVLTVADQGNGFPADFDPLNAKSLGWKIIQGYVQQIRGKVKWRNEDGAIIQVSGSMEKLEREE